MLQEEGIADCCTVAPARLMPVQIHPALRHLLLQPLALFPMDWCPFRRLNARLASACSSSMQELCAGVHCKEHEVCGGAMLRCLTDQAENITVPDCQHVSPDQSAAFDPQRSTPS